MASVELAFFMPPPGGFFMGDTMVISEMEIRLRADIARLQRDMDAARQTVTSATNGMARAADAAKSALAGIGLGLGMAQIVQMTDQYTKFTAQLRLATTSASEYAHALATVKAISTTAQSSMADMGVLYAKIANGTRELGNTQKQVAEITEVVGLGLKVSGATAQEASSAMLQLSQAFASGVLRGEEFNAVNEAGPRVMLALAEGIGVPVGALKKMAEEGKLTSAVLSEALPRSLQKLREEAKEVETISGAFQVLKDRMMEVTAVRATENGSVAVLTQGISLLAENLASLLTAITGLTAIKVATWAAEWVSGIYRKVTAAAALRAATIATAEAEVAATTATLAKATSDRAGLVVTQERAVAQLRATNVTIASSQAAIAAASAAGAQSFALRVLRDSTRDLAAAESMRAALLTETAALDRAKIAASAQITAAQTAQAAAQRSLNVATNSGSLAAGLAGRAIGFLGGPLSAFISLLGIGATAWAIWGNKAKVSNEQAAESYEQSHKRIIKGLDEQIAKNERLLQLKNGGMSMEQIDRNLPRLDQLAAATQRLSDINSRKGEFASGKSETDLFFARAAVMKDIVELTQKMQQAEASTGAVAAKTVAERVTAFKKEHATRGEQMAAELKAIEDLKGKTSEYGEMVRRIREKYADKDAAAQLRQEQAAYQSLITSIREKMAANDLELSGYVKLSESQQMTIKLDAAISTGKNKLSTEHVKEARAMIAKVEAQEQAIDMQQRAAKWAEIEAKNDADHYASLRASTAAIDDRIAQMEREIEMYGLSTSAAIDMEKAKLEAKLAAGPATYAELAALDSQIEKLGQLAKLARNKEALDANKKAADQMAADQQRLWGDIERTAHDTFISIFDSGKSAFDRLTDALKNGLYELLYQMTVKQWIINIGASMGVTGGVSGVAQAGSAMGSVVNGGSALSSLSGLSGLSGLTSIGGSAIAGIGNFIGSSTMSAFGAGFAGSTGGMAMTASEVFASMGMAAEASAASIGALASAALPWVAGLGVAVALWKKFDTSGTSHTGGASSASTAGAQTIRAESIGFQHTKVSSQVNDMTAQLARGVVGILDSTALTFGKTAGYTAATAFADDTSKDGAWGSLVIKNLDGKVIDWNDTRRSKWAPKEFADGQKGQEQYLSEISKSVRSALDGIGLPAWARDMLNSLGSNAGLDEMAQVVQEINKTQSALKGIGQQMSIFANLSDGVASKLMAAAGGIDALANSAAAYYNGFYSDNEKTAAAMTQVSQTLASVGLSMPATKAEFRALVEANMALGEAGAKTVATLLGVSGVFAQLKDAAGEATVDLTSYRSALTEAYNAESQALQSTIARMGSFASSLRNLRGSALLGNLSPLSPTQKYAEAKSQYEAVLAAARGGDEAAQGRYQDAYTAFLEASRTVFASSIGYTRDFDYAQAATEEAAKWAESQIDVGQAQLDSLKASVSGLIEVNKSVLSVREAIQQLNEAMGKNTAPLTGYAPVSHGPIIAAPTRQATTDALVGAVKALSSENAKLRAEQQQQTGDIIRALQGSAEASSEKIASTVKSVSNTEYRVLPS